MKKFKLAFGIHNHQPVGNFTAVFEDAHQKAYAPFVKLLSQHPALRISFHQSGILWDWQKGAHPEYFEDIGRMVDAGQLELMTGGFYEPILVSIPERDALGQIGQLNSFLSDHFGAEVTGLWLTERIWEPHLPKLLAQAGVKYLPVDDTHFIYAGFEHDQLTGPFVTENEGFSVTLLPIQKRLRYLVPFGKVEDVIAELKVQAESNPEGVAIYADDGEKFGVWPGTHDHCYTEGWLEQLFEALEAESDWLEVVPLAEAAAMESVGRAYLPSASYAEMLHWALPPHAFVEYETFEEWLKSCGKTERYGRFVRGGHWRGFLAKYDESNLMHKKMQRLSDRLADAVVSGEHTEEELAPVRNHLFAAQCNCPYWHGVFGGLYLPHLRQGVYGHMVKGATELHRLSGGEPTLEMTDYDRDGRPEVLFESQPMSAVVKPDRGGSLVELCLNQHGFNATDTLTRRREGYHLKLDRAVATGTESDGQKSIHEMVLAKEEGLKDHLVDDWYLKRCFIDHFFTHDVNLEKFKSGRFGEEGDFILERYDVETDPEHFQVNLVRNGFVRRPEGEFPIRVVKSYRFDPDQVFFTVEYNLSSSHPAGVEVNFGVENNFNLLAGHAIDRYVSIDFERPDDSFLDSVGSARSARAAALVDEYRDLALAVVSHDPAEIWRLPIFTVSLSEGGFERVYQGTTILHRYSLRLGAEPVELRFAVRGGIGREVLPHGMAFGVVSK
jgi:alpha-amylase